MAGSSTGDAAPQPSLGERLRRVTWTRVAFMAGVIALGLVFANVTGGTKSTISKDRAVRIAAAEIDFTPEGHNIRFIRRGIPPKPFWVVSLWTRDRQTGDYKRITVVLVDAKSGRVAQVRRAA